MSQAWQDPAWLRQALPHRPPMLLVDRVLALEPGLRAVGEKFVSQQEPALQGHFPGEPIFPGVLQIEALAQLGAALVLGEAAHPEGALPILTGVEACRFRRVVRPGEVLRLEVRLTKRRGRFGWLEAEAKVGEELACACQLSFSVGLP